MAQLTVRDLKEFIDNMADDQLDNVVVILGQDGRTTEAEELDIYSDGSLMIIE